jgi:hypothetical protein
MQIAKIPQRALQNTSVINNATFSLAHSPQATSTTIYIPLKDTARVLSLERVFLARLVPYVGDGARRFGILQRSQRTSSLTNSLTHRQPVDSDPGGRVVGVLVADGDDLGPFERDKNTRVDDRVAEFLHVIGSWGASRVGAGRGIEGISIERLDMCVDEVQADVLVEKRDNAAEGYRGEWEIDDQFDVLRRQEY